MKIQIHLSVEEWAEIKATLTDTEHALNKEIPNAEGRERQTLKYRRDAHTKMLREIGQVIK